MPVQHLPCDAGRSQLLYPPEKAVWTGRHVPAPAGTPPPPRLWRILCLPDRPCPARLGEPDHCHASPGVTASRQGTQSDCGAPHAYQAPKDQHHRASQACLSGGPSPDPAATCQAVSEQSAPSLSCQLHHTCPAIAKEHSHQNPPKPPNQAFSPFSFNCPCQKTPPHPEGSSTFFHKVSPSHQEASVTRFPPSSCQSVPSCSEAGPEEPCNAQTPTTQHPAPSLCCWCL